MFLPYGTAGEAPLRCGSTSTSTPRAVDDSTAPGTPTWRGDAQSPHASSPQSQTHPPRSNPRETPSSASSARRTSTAPNNNKKSGSRASSGDSGGGGGGGGGVRGIAGKEKGAASAEEGSAGSRSSTSKGGKGLGLGKTERRDGVVEKAISDAEDLVVCVLHPGGEGKGNGNGEGKGEGKGGFRDGADG